MKNKKESKGIDIDPVVVVPSLAGKRTAGGAKRGQDKTKIFYAQEIVKENKGEATRMLSRLLYAKYPLVYSSAEDARDNVKRARGNGAQERYGDPRYMEKYCVQKRTPEEARMAHKNKSNARSRIVDPLVQVVEAGKRVRLGMLAFDPDPTSFNRNAKLEGADNWLILPDVHIPYFDKNALNEAVEYGKKKKVNGVLLNGDFSDCYQLSDFVKDPAKRHFKEEVDMVRKMLYEINRLLKPSAFIWKLGNHEYRLDRYLMMKAPELFKMKQVSHEWIYGTEELGIKMVSHCNPITFQGLTILHGDEYRGGMVSPVNPARGIFLKAKACVYVSHHHTSSTHTETNINDEIVTCWSSGCLCDLHPEYSTFNRWNHGFGIIETKGKFWQVKNKSIIKGKVYEG